MWHRAGIAEGMKLAFTTSVAEDYAPDQTPTNERGPIDPKRKKKLKLRLVLNPGTPGLPK
jgi:hypothetical protein